MGVNVVNYGGKTLVDMRNATATAETVLAGYTAYGADGDLVVGTMTPTLHKTVSVTLSKNLWIDNQQTVSVDFATAEAMVIAGGEPESQEYFDCEVWCSGQDDGRLIFSCTYEPMEDVIANIGMLMTGELVISYARGSMIQLTDAAERKLRGLTIYGKTTQSGTPSPTAPVPLVSAGDGGSIIVTIGTSESDTNPQTLTVSTPNGLPGIHVSEGGNYTDENGWQWICDEVDFAKGVYVQRIGKGVISGNNIKSLASDKATDLSLLANLTGIVNSENGITNRFCLSDRFPSYYRANPQNTWHVGDVESIGFHPSDIYCQYLYIRIYRNRLDSEDLAGVKAFFDNNNCTVLYQLVTPIETDLSAEQLAAYAALRTYSPSTTIYTNTEADMMVRYVKE